MWATSALPRNERLPGMGGGREAMADKAHGHGVNVHKNREASVDKKMGERGVTWNFSVSPPTIVDSNDRSTYWSVCTMATIWGKILKPAVVTRRLSVVPCSITSKE